VWNKRPFSRRQDRERLIWFRWGIRPFYVLNELDGGCAEIAAIVLRWLPPNNVTQEPKNVMALG